MSKKIVYQCQRCTACCRWPGFVRLREEEIAPIARHLGLEEHDFIQRYTRLMPRRDGLALIDKPNGECFFLEGNDCVLQSVKPSQCKGFPNTWNFPGWEKVCEAIPIEVDEAMPLSELVSIDGERKVTAFPEGSLPPAHFPKALSRPAAGVSQRRDR